MVTNAERDEKIQSHGDRIQSIEQYTNGLKTTIEDQREVNNEHFHWLEDMVGTILEEISLGNAKVLWIHQLLHTQLPNIHLSYHLKNYHS